MEIGTAKIGCSCGGTKWDYDEPLTEASEMTCAACGAVTNYGKAMDAARDAAKAFVTKQIKDSLRGIPGISVE